MTSSLLGENVQDLRARYRAFIESTRCEGGFCLTPRADSSAYALCFAIFGFQLVQDHDSLARNAAEWDAKLRSNLRAVRESRAQKADLSRDKAYLQLLTFTLSALAVLGTLADAPLNDEVREVLRTNVRAELEATGALSGVSRSGNHAMFMGILLLHARDYLDIDTSAAVEQWVSLHKESMNSFGFWGSARSMSHLQFQNGYHQYELLDYLGVAGIPWSRAAQSVALLADSEGHFAPYPGGGGCYDYDAVFILTIDSMSAQRYHELLQRTARSIVAEQNIDGGFGESQRIRPRSMANLRRTLTHVLEANGVARKERLRYGLTLLRAKHDRIHTHWSQYSREWGESNLWDSWFRVLALARIDVASNSARSSNWGFIPYPGIGFHHATVI